jgi:RHS repeat-associated protein
VTDGLGSVVNILDTNGSVEATYEYDPYGMVHSATGFHATDNPIRFAGGVQDTEGTDFVKFGQRWYNPAQGRFTQQDNLAVIGDPASGNRYAYAACNPVNYTDPTGQLPESCWYAIGGLAISIITFEIGIFTSPTGWGAVAAVLGYFGILFSARGVLDSCPVD